MTPKQALVAHMKKHGFDRPAGTFKQLIHNHKHVHDSNVYLTHWHRIEGWDSEGNQILAVDDQIAVRISLAPPKNPNASKNGDRNWTLNISHANGGYRYEIPGTRQDDSEGAKAEANKILGYKANWVLNETGYGYQHKEKK